MFSRKFKTADGKTHEAHGPTMWSEFLTEHWVRLIKGWTNQDDLTQMLSVLYNVDYDTLYYAPDKLVNPIVDAAHFILSEQLELKTRPVKDYITMGGRDYLVPRNVGSMAFGKMVQAKALLAKSFEENVAMWAAMFLVPREERFSMDRARELEQLVLQQPIEQIYPISFFFVSGLMNRGTALTPVSNLIPRKPKTIVIKLGRLQELTSWPLSLTSKLSVDTVAYSKPWTPTTSTDSKPLTLSLTS